jgi:uncharacterized protein
MKIGVLSDSHDHLNNIQKAVDIFIGEGVEKIVHCGDMVSPFIGRAMQAIKGNNIEAHAIWGNNDGERDYFFKVMGDFIQFDGIFFDCSWDDIKIAAYHGTLDKILECIIDSKHYDLILCGHTHQIRVEERNGVLIVNPGECCGYLTGQATCAIINLEQKPLTESSVNIINLN